MLINFFILPNKDDRDYLQFIITIVKHLYKENKTIMIHAEEEFCEKLDHLLWFNGKNYFFPHAYINENTQKYIYLPIIISKELNILKNVKKDIIIDTTFKYSDIELHEIKTSFFIKVVNQKPLRLESSRKLYKSLRDNQYIVNIHKL